MVQKDPNVSKNVVRQALGSRGYRIGNLYSHKLFGKYSGQEVVMPDYLLAYAMVAHRGQLQEADYLKAKSVIQNPDFISEDLRGEENSFLLNKRISENRWLEAGIHDVNGQLMFHFMLRNDKKNQQANSENNKVRGQA
ncbi:MAG: hypothetical protein PUF82_05615 [Lactobacillus equicursoris]|uniref:hypothetical protein n=1 Tax=Lactobacillus equicursoris TaxID=420645 RepID=UPI00242B128A|nr:hypothetical protein [Lactobacillus equicursoris]MDD6407457.1 hypothetical protein [Lactobacillus equicursoris]